jgi:hypothetical protein
MDAEFSDREATLCQSVDAALDDSASRASPSGMQDCRGSRRVDDEHRYAVSDGNDEGDAAIARHVPVRFVDAKPAVPLRMVNDYLRPVNLRCRNEACAAGAQFFAQLAPAPHYLHCGLLGC